MNEEKTCGNCEHYKLKFCPNGLRRTCEMGHTIAVAKDCKDYVERKQVKL